MFKLLPVLDVCNSNLSYEEYSLLIDYYENPNDSFVMTNINELSDDLLSYYTEEDKTITIIKSLISKLKISSEQSSLSDNEDFIMLFQW